MCTEEQRWLVLQPVPLSNSVNKLIASSAYSMMVRAKDAAGNISAATTALSVSHKNNIIQTIIYESGVGRRTANAIGITRLS